MHLRFWIWNSILSETLCGNNAIKLKANIVRESRNECSVRFSAQYRCCREMADSNKLSTSGNHGFQEVAGTCCRGKRAGSLAWYTGSSACWNRKTVRNGRERKRRITGERTRRGEYWKKKYWCRVHTPFSSSLQERIVTPRDLNLIAFKDHQRKCKLAEKY